MLVYFALGNAKFWRRVHWPTPTPDARYFAFWWNIGLKVRRWFVYVCGAGLICVTEVAPHWSRLRNSMIMRVYNDVTLGLTTAHWPEKS